MPILPFKLNQDRRHHIPKQKHQVMNPLGALLRSWREYDASLRQRGSLTVWFTGETTEAWRGGPRTTRGGQPLSASLTSLRGIAARWYPPLAILTALTLRAVFGLALRQTEGLIGSVVHLPGLDLAVPDHPTLSRRAETLEAPRPQPRRDGEPLHLLVDGTGLKLCGAGEWLAEQQGAKPRRSWRKLRIGREADTGQIVAAAPTAKDIDDGAEGGPLLDQVAATVASPTAGAAPPRRRGTARTARLPEPPRHAGRGRAGLAAA